MNQFTLSKEPTVFLLIVQYDIVFHADSSLAECDRRNSMGPRFYSHGIFIIASEASSSNQPQSTSQLKCTFRSRAITTEDGPKKKIVRIRVGWRNHMLFSTLSLPCLILLSDRKVLARLTTSLLPSRDGHAKSGCREGTVSSPSRFQKKKKKKRF